MVGGGRGHHETLREETPKVIDMKEPWMEGVKRPKQKFGGSVTSGEADRIQGFWSCGTTTMD